MRKSPRWSDEDEVQAWKLHREGMNYRQIAAIMKRSPSTIGERLKGMRGGIRRSEVIGESRIVIPPSRLELRDALYALPYPPTLAIMGDPQPGRRELIERYR